MLEHNTMATLKNIPASDFLDVKHIETWPKWVLVRDNRLDTYVHASRNYWNHMRIYTELPEDLLVTWVVHCISNQLTNILNKNMPENEKESIVLRNTLIELRGLVNLYFDAQKLHRPPFISNPPTLPTGQQDIKQYIDNYQSGIRYFLPESKDIKMRMIVASISLFLARLIKFYKFSNGEIFHLPWQIQSVAKNYTKGYYLLDSYYKFDEETKKVKDMRAEDSGK